MLEYDNHTLLVYHDNRTTDQLQAQLKNHFVDFYLNNIKDGSLGIAYLFLRNPNDYFALVGKEEVIIESVDSGTSSSWADTEILTKTIKVEPTVTLPGISFKRAFIVPPSEEFKANVLFCPVVPEGVTVKDIEHAFEQFLTVPVSFSRRKRSLVVTFPDGNHAGFALHMCKQLYIKGHFLSFKHARY